MKQSLPTLSKLALAVSALAVAAPAISQSVLEEIVVVAQKREQNLQDVPIAISAFTGEQMDADFDDTDSENYLKQYCRFENYPGVTNGDLYQAVLAS